MKLFMATDIGWLAMRNKPLAFQIWVVISGILLLISILLLILFPTTLRGFFTEEIYKTIENEQGILIEYGHPESHLESTKQRDRSVTHFVLPLNRPFYLRSRELPSEFIQHTQILATNQAKVVERYEVNLKDQTLFYVIRKLVINGEESYLLSYSWDSYRNGLVYALFQQLIIIMGIVFILSWIPSIWLARYLSRPLVILERHVKEISEQKWHEPIVVDRNDEIGKLGDTIEKMRQDLVKKDESQQTLLQNISHDLKTPVMVIRGYAKSVNDGIFPKGNLTSTMNVIESESEKLEKKIRDLLYLTKLDFLSEKRPKRSTFRLDKLLINEIDRLKWTMPERIWKIKLDIALISGDEEQWEKLVENLLENSIRYAKKNISISLTEVNAHFILRLWNDGPKIDENIIDHIFEPFQKGKKGNFGIGLSIVQRIAALHQASIWAANEDEGATFYMKIPQNKE